MNNMPPHFTLEELTRSQFASRNGIVNEPNDTQLGNLVRLAWFLEALRGKLRAHYDLNLFIIVSSGLRVEELNLILGGSKTSAHMRGLAADITVPGLTPLELAQFIANHMGGEGFDQVIHEFESWVHVGLCVSGLSRYQELTAVRKNGKTVYKIGLS